jgi:outer membrane protein assembly factor BamD (BamD/ComL family)
VPRDRPGFDAYSRKHPRGRLQLEAKTLRIHALASSGQRAAAELRAEAFLKRHPNSVLASPIREYLED